MRKRSETPSCVSPAGVCEALEPRRLLSGSYTYQVKANLDGINGASPTAPVTLDAAGDVFGTTTAGGTGNLGTVFEVAAGSAVPVAIYSFDGTAIPGQSQGPIAVDATGDILGVNQAPSGTSTELWEVKKATDGSYTPIVLSTLDSTICLSGVVMDAQGNCYGACLAAPGDTQTAAATFIFELVANSPGVYTYNSVIPSSNVYAGSIESPLTIDSNGTIFGSSTENVLELPAPNRVPFSLGTIPGAFGYATDGITEDSAGDLFGTVVNPNEIYEYTHSAQAVSVVATPGFPLTGPPVPDALGGLIGTTDEYSASGGVVYNIPAGSSTPVVLHAFDGNLDGAAPGSFLTEDKNGNIFGVAESGGPVDDSSGDTAGFIFELLAPQPTTQLAFNQQPINGTAGTDIAPPITVDLEDIAGAVVATDTSNVTLSIASGPAGAIVGGTVTAPSVDGEAVFSDITLSEPGAYTLVASDGTLTTATSTTFTLAAGANNAPQPNAASVHLKFAVIPRKAVEQTTLTPAFTVDVLNIKGKLVTADESAVTVSIFSGTVGGTLVGTLSVPAINGIATFSDLTFSASGRYVLTTTDASLKAAKSPAIAVSPLPPASLNFLQMPSDVIAGAAFASPVILQVLDKDGNLVIGDHSVVKLSILSGPLGGKLLGPAAAVHGGIATFTHLRTVIAGTYTLLASDGIVTPATSASFAVAAGAPKKARFVAAPKTLPVDSTISVSVEELDPYGNVAFEDSAALTVTVTRQPTASALIAALVPGQLDQDLIQFSEAVPATAPGLYVLVVEDFAKPSVKASVAIRVT